MVSRTFIYISLFSVFSLLSACNKSNSFASLALTNATIWTGDPSNPIANAIAISDDRILAIGSKEEIEKYITPKTKVIDQNGAFIAPGFIDSHVHFLTGGMNLSSVQLRDANTPEAFIKRIADYAKTVPDGTWILGGDWDHENWGGELPSKDWIDIFTTKHPVFITRLDGHMSLANSLALHLSGIDDNVQNVDGGAIVRDLNGHLTGIFKDNAASLVGRYIPEQSSKQIDQALSAAMNHVASKGVTSVHHMVGYYDALKRAEKKGSLITRIYAMFPLSNWVELKEEVELNGHGNEWLKIGGLKGFIDGSLGSHTAAFHDPYHDTPEEKGFFVNEESHMHQWIEQADQAGLQVMIHAIGDHAINFLLNTYESVTKKNGPKDRRFRIEHAQHIAPEDISRFNTLDVIPSMQPYHAIDDGRWAEKVIGSERIKTTYAFRSLFDAKAKVAFGSDWFVAPPTPLEGIYAAVTRRTLDNKNPNGWVPEQKISVEEALTAYTINAAYASFEEPIKGSLVPGKLADLVVIQENLLTIDPVNIKDARILRTIVGGKTVYEYKK